MTTSRGSLVLVEARCTSCDLCVKECPDECISLESHLEVVGHTGPGSSGRARREKVLDRFAVDYGLCLYCGICVEVCPFDALEWSATLVPATSGRLALVHEREELKGL